MFSPSNGGSNVVMFLKRLEKDQKTLHVKFYDQSGWSQEVKINDNSIHYQSAIMFQAPAYRIKDNTTDVAVSVKVYVPFRDDKEKQEFIRQQYAEDRDEDDPEIVMENNPTSSEQITSSTSSSDLYRETPDGKYESPRMDFIYKPPDINPSKRKLDTLLFYEFHDIAEREATDEVSKTSRKNLARRQRDLIKENIDTLTNPNVSDFLKEPFTYQTDPIFLNFVIKHSNEFSNLNIKNDDTDYYGRVSETTMVTETEIQPAIENRYNLERQASTEQQQKINSKDTVNTTDNMLEVFENISKQDEFDIESIMNLISSNDSFFQNDSLSQINKY